MFHNITVFTKLFDQINADFFQKHLQKSYQTQTFEC